MSVLEREESLDRNWQSRNGKAAASTAAPSHGIVLQRKCACGGQESASQGECDECKKKQETLQRRAASPAGPAAIPPIVHNALNSPGQPLDSETRNFMESRFGHDFGNVRVHTDEEAAQSAREVNASAYTVGSRVVLDKSKYEPNTPSGLRLMAHELTHVMQQEGSKTVPETHGAIGPSDHPSEREADQVADSVLGGGAGTGIKVTGSAASVLRRQPASGTASGSPELSGEMRTIARFDVSPGSKRPWNLNELTKTIVEALSASDLAYVRILGVYPTKANEDDPQGSAYERADKVRRALIQWIGPKKFDESRYDVAFASGSLGDPEIEVMIAYKGRVISEGKGGGSALSSAPPPKASPSKAQPAPPVPSLITTPAYPASKSDMFSAFLATSVGQQLKAAALKELKKVWTKTSTAEKIGIIVNLLLAAGAATYGIAEMSPNQQKGILDLIVGDDDKLLQQPPPAKTMFQWEFKF